MHEVNTRLLIFENARGGIKKKKPKMSGEPLQGEVEIDHMSNTHRPALPRRWGEENSGIFCNQRTPQSCFSTEIYLGLKVV